jgi:hypothetical protein
VSDLAVGGMEVGSEPELVWLLIASAIIALIIIFRRQRLVL